MSSTGHRADWVARSMHPSADLRCEPLALYRFMLAARKIDQVEGELVMAGVAFFHVSGAGHEGSAVLNTHLTAKDWLHLHYRDKALMLARGISPGMFFRSLLCRASSHSAGRQMSAHMSAPELRILSTVGPVGNNALQAVGVAAAVRDDPERAIVVCSMGDGTTQQGEVLEAIAEASRSALPVLFWIEDNGYSISTPTDRKTFYALPSGCERPDSFFGIPIHHLDGWDVAHCHDQVGEVVRGIRTTRRPAIVVFRVARLSNHTNADDERVYRTGAEIEHARRDRDPVSRLRKHLIRSGLPEQVLDRIDAEVDAEAREAARGALQAPAPEPTFEAKRPDSDLSEHADAEYRGGGAGPRLTMLEAIRDVLRVRMREDPRINLYGEDIEDPKGDVFGLTRGLTASFPNRVRNSPLSEATILGVAIGRALAGERPVAFIQFADFLPLAFNQIASELGTMHWRTAGGWQCPVIVMAACGGYRPGLGPFHAQTLESVMAHTPGLDVVMPSDAADAAGLLNAAFRSGRPTIFLYPKACLNDPDRATSSDVASHLVSLGKARHIRRGADLTVVTWGSTVPICERAAQTLEGAGMGVDLMDLRSIAPWDEAAVVASCRRTGRLIVVHEDNRTCGFASEVIASVVETIGARVECRRVVRPDTPVPCNYANQLEVLPSYHHILTVAAEMLDLDIAWNEVESEGRPEILVEATGSSPADQSVTVVSWRVRAGDHVRPGQKLAELESDKAVYEIAASAAGRVAEILVDVGRTVRIGTPILRLRTDGAPALAVDLRPHRGESARIRRRSRPAPVVLSASDRRRVETVGMSVPVGVDGTGRLTNRDLAESFRGVTEADIVRRTGIESRPRLDGGETLLSLAVKAARGALAGEGLAIDDIDLILCSTTTPPLASPSTACLILAELCPEPGYREIPAYDVSAACAGYLYGLASAFDFLQTHPRSRVLIVTAEALSQLVDATDFETAVLFGDAATATVLHGAELARSSWARLRRPIVSARGDGGKNLKVDLNGKPRIEMNGKTVFSEAVRGMVFMLKRVCEQSGVAIADLDLVVPHQANGRIIEAVRSRLSLPEHRMHSNIRHRGNTSSSSIPLCLAELAASGGDLTRIGLVAFGAGFTLGAAILEGSRRGSADEQNDLPC